MIDIFVYFFYGVATAFLTFCFFDLLRHVFPDYLWRLVKRAFEKRQHIGWEETLLAIKDEFRNEKSFLRKLKMASSLIFLYKQPEELGENIVVHKLVASSLSSDCVITKPKTVPIEDTNIFMREISPGFYGIGVKVEVPNPKYVEGGDEPPTIIQNRIDQFINYKVPDKD